MNSRRILERTPVAFLEGTSGGFLGGTSDRFSEETDE